MSVTQRPKQPEAPPEGKVCDYCVQWEEPEPKPATIFCRGCGKWYCAECLMMH